MSEKDSSKYSKTDWKKLATMKEEEIDYADIPPLDDHYFDRATQRNPNHSEVVVTLQVDPDVFEWFNAQEGGWEQRIRAALRIYAEAHKE
jgi:uncharacterized protein (DUF4415 family)